MNYLDDPSKSCTDFLPKLGVSVRARARSRARTRTEKKVAHGVISQERLQIPVKRSTISTERYTRIFCSLFKCGVYLHGLTNEFIAKKRRTSYGVIASDLIAHFASAYTQAAQ